MPLFSRRKTRQPQLPLTTARQVNANLMGGTYYPNKMKRRKRPRPQGNNKTRFSFVSCGFIVIVLYYRSRKGGTVHRGTDLLPDSRLQRLDVWLNRNSNIYNLHEINKNNTDERLKWLRQLDPKFYHRFFLDVSPGNQEISIDSPEQQQLAPPPSDDGLRTLHNMHNYYQRRNCPSEPPQDIQTTLVLQTTPNRLAILQETCRRWRDPIVAVVAVSSDQEMLPSFTDCPHITWIRYTLTKAEQTELYPVNRLRNMGLDRVSTSHVLVFDVDFVPSDDLPDLLRNELASTDSRTRTTTPQALVVPAFERVLDPPCTVDTDCLQHIQQDSSFLPHNFTLLQKCVDQGDCIVFQSRNNPAGHSSTRTTQWLQKKWYDTTTEHQQVPRRIKCFDTARYEPYVVLEWCQQKQRSEQQPQVPYYDERFHGYGKNKIEHIQHLRLLGFQFSVLPRGFMVHHPHPESHIKERWNAVQESDLHTKMDQLYRKFLEELFEKYYDDRNNIIETCKK